MGVAHYENFPVASWLLPARLRAPVRAIYRFARTADDVADEGDDPPPLRLAKLAYLAAQLDAIEAGRANEWPDLADAVARHALPVALLRDLLSAFAQDVVVRRYADYDELLDYCRRSANPIGRLLLHLYRRHDPALAAQSDSICTALQLTNFWQDVALDFAKGRVYLPASELLRFGVGEDAIGAGRVDAAWSALMAAQTARARAMLESGAPLARALGGRIGLELRLVVQGGLRILERIDAVAGDVFGRRPVLHAADWLRMTVRAGFM
ncbi:MAG: squalene synthase HpnC [Burkholderiaceae bacterium]